MYRYGDINVKSFIIITDTITYPLLVSILERDTELAKIKIKIEELKDQKSHVYSIESKSVNADIIVQMVYSKVEILTDIYQKWNGIIENEKRKLNLKQMQLIELKSN